MDTDQGSRRARQSQFRNVFDHVKSHVIEVFSDPCEAAYAVVKLRGYDEVLEVRSPEFDRWVVSTCAGGNIDPPSRLTREQVIDLLAAETCQQEEPQAVFERIGWDGDTLWLDLCDPDHQYVRVDSQGWKVVSKCPVRFIRGQGMNSLPVPIRSDGGRGISFFGDLLGLSDSELALVVGFMLGALHPPAEIEFPILAVTGEHRSGKTLLTQSILRTIDPREDDIRSLPGSEQDLAIAGRRRAILAFDNVSRLSPEMSDALCRVSSGFTFSKRRLYTDMEEAKIPIHRQVILNGITDFITRADLVDRTIQIERTPSPDTVITTNRKDFWELFTDNRADMLGELLHAVSVALRKCRTMPDPEGLRLIDFTKWVSAAEGKMPWESGGFVEAYRNNQRDMIQSAVHSSPVGSGILSLIETENQWTGTAAQLKDALTGIEVQNVPATEIGVGSELTRITPALRQMGIDVSRDREGGTGRRLISIHKTPTP